VRDPTSRWERRFCVAVFVVAVAVGCALLLAGEPLPPLVPVLLLAVLVALSVNLGALFPSEFSATADVALLFAAVVGFAIDAPLLGPFAVGLMMGPFDWVHWKQRLFYRMAYNSGSQSLCILLAALLFRVASPGTEHVIAVLAVTAAAAVLWMVGDIALVTLVLVRRGGTSVLAAARHVLMLDGLAVPFALVGAAAGMLAIDTGWWMALVVLAPMPFVPDLVLVRARRMPIRRAVAAVRVPLLAAVLAGAGVVAGDADPVVIVALVVMGVGIGVESRPTAGVLVAPVVATVVLTVAVVVGRDDAALVAVLVALGGVGAALFTGRRVTGATGTIALALGATAAVACVAVYLALDHTPGERAVVAAALAGVAFQVLVVAAGSRPCRPALARGAWSLPLVAVSAALAVAWGALGARAGSLLFAVALGGALTAVVWWGAPPWTSRMLARVIAGARGRRCALAASAIAACATAVVAVAATGTGETRTALVMLALAVAESVVAMAAVAVRQWRFVPRRRAFDGAVLVVIGCSLLFGYPVLGLDGRVWSAVVLIVLLVPAVIVAWPLGALAEAVVARPPAPTEPSDPRDPRDPDGQRMPESRSASA
jgi:hypothetical protein